MALVPKGLKTLWQSDLPLNARGTVVDGDDALWRRALKLLKGMEGDLDPIAELNRCVDSRLGVPKTEAR